MTSRARSHASREQQNNLGANAGRQKASIAAVKAG
jgi:hypothetical protein